MPTAEPPAAALVTGRLAPEHRARVAEIVRATGAFSEAEVAVAVELFDSAMPGAGSREPGAGDAAPVPGPRTPDPDYSFLGAFDDAGTLVGFACWGPTPGTDRTFDLYWIAVHPSAQGLGAGTLLLSDVERTLRADDARLLVVETSSRSGYAAARAFYGRHGYGEAARVRDFYAPADDRILFVKRFHGGPRDGAGMQAR